MPRGGVPMRALLRALFSARVDAGLWFRFPAAILRRARPCPWMAVRVRVRVCVCVCVCVCEGERVSVCMFAWVYVCMNVRM